MDSKKEIVFIVNPISGTHSKEFILHQIEKRLDHSLYNYTIRKTEYAGHAIEIARQAAEEKKDIVVAIGGDGTINEIGRSLIHTDTAMGIIPCGSGNGLARHLHIPLEARGAIDVLNQGYIKTIDYGTIDSRPFFCTCGVGFDAFVSLKFADSGKRGLLTYLENTLHESLTYRPETYEIENSSGTVRYKAFLIACANASQYGNNAYIAPQASLTDGMMDITILEPFTVLDVPALSFQLFNKTIDQNSRIKTLKEKKITIGFICHDIALVQSVAHQVAVMYLGNLVEEILGHELNTKAVHPYTKALMGSAFDIHMDFSRPIESIESEAPSPLDLPKGCPFQDRCEYCMDICKKETPHMIQVAPGHSAACHLLKPTVR